MKNGFSPRRGSATILEGPAITAQYFQEPRLLFADGKQHIDPKLGIAAFGPRSLSPLKRHPSQIRVGFIGTAETVDLAKRWLEECSEGVMGDEEHPTFPGSSDDRGLFSTLVYDADWVGQISHAELSDALKSKPGQTMFEYVIQLVEDKLSLLAGKDRAPEYIIVALPDSLLRKCQIVEYFDPALGMVHRDFRRAFKSVAMKYRIPTQFLRQETIDGRADDYPSEIAWDFFTGLYSKAGGTPWGPVGLAPSTCYVGIGFYRPLGTHASVMQTSLVQAFDEHGDGLVLRGHPFTWDPKQEKSRSPHLSEEQAYDLIGMVLSSYQAELRQVPQRVVVHKTSRYWPAERSGFERALRERVQHYSLLALAPQSTVRLFTENLYPPLRGTHFRVEEIDYLYTTGYLGELMQYHSVHVPSPLQIADHVGYDTPRDILLKEILILTKMNWNSSKLGGLMPITIRFSRLVGDIMREVPASREPLTNFKYYM